MIQRTGLCGSGVFKVLKCDHYRVGVDTSAPNLITTAADI